MRGFTIAIFAVLALATSLQAQGWYTGLDSRQQIVVADANGSRVGNSPVFASKAEGDAWIAANERKADPQKCYNLGGCKCGCVITGSCNCRNCNEPQLEANVGKSPLLYTNYSLASNEALRTGKPLVVFVGYQSPRPIAGAVACHVGSFEGDGFVRIVVSVVDDGCLTRYPVSPGVYAILGGSSDAQILAEIRRQEAAREAERRRIAMGAYAVPMMAFAPRQTASC